MAAEQNRRLVRQAIDEIWNGGHLELADRVFAPDYVNHGGLIPDLVHGPEAIKVSVVLYRKAFPRFQLAILDLLAQDETVSLRWAAHRTPGRDTSNGKPIDGAAPLLGMTFGRVAEGRIAESWTCWEGGSALGPDFVRELRPMARSA
jgi:predicted SnoaL-like aldol condensation-catalyzing enzyme